MRRRGTRLVAVFIGVFLTASLILTTGCGESRDLSETAPQMLQAATPEFISLQGFQEDLRLVTIDISDFVQYDTTEYQKWVEDTYTDENTAIVFFTDQDQCFTDVNEAEEYLSSNGYDASSFEFDWTAVRISRKSDKQKISENITLDLDISYPMIHAIEGFELKMKYVEEAWNVDEMISTYIS